MGFGVRRISGKRQRHASDDIFTIDPVKIKDAKVLMTIVDGRVVFEKK
ncbi:MAG: hypothetical protein IPP63_18660 [Chloracidobacterium sp.]|nr:hypothetical protein [Chloracidobacterium sp.]